MAEIFPFRAYRYNTARVSLEQVLTQPYDKITAEMQQRYYGLSPYSLVAVEKGKTLPGDDASHNAYTRAAQALNQWVAEGILLRESAPAIYVYFQDYSEPGAVEKKTRRGFIALGRVEDYSAGAVFRHEQTLAGPRADRLELLRHTRAHTGQLFMLYTDPQRRIDALLDEYSRELSRDVAGVPAPVSVRDEYGVTHRLRPVLDAESIRRLVTVMAGQKLVIADGHHRYETALAYRDECRAKQDSVSRDDPHERVMMTFVNTESEGLTILPTHRVVARLGGFDFVAWRRTLGAWFKVERFPLPEQASRGAAYADFRRRLAGGRQQRAIGLYGGDGAFWLLTLRAEADLAALIPGVSARQLRLDVVLLHRLILEKGLGISPAAVSAESHLRYEREVEAAVAAVDKGHAQACFLLNAVTVGQVMEIALAGEVLPQKSTDFYPKLLSGLTIYRLDE